MRDGSRNVGAMYAMDNWKITPELRFSYGAKYARYDYLADRGLLSPRVTMILQPDSNDSLTVRTTVMHREVAPGAEEFIPPSMGLWLPPERTFSQVSRASFLPERHDQFEIAVDREWAEHVIVGFRAFKEQVDDQVVTIFGLSFADTPAKSVTTRSALRVISARTAGASRSLGRWARTLARASTTRRRRVMDRPIGRQRSAGGARAVTRSDRRAHPRRDGIA